MAKLKFSPKKNCTTPFLVVKKKVEFEKNQVNSLRETGWTKISDGRTDGILRIYE